MNRINIKDAIYGLAIGDALGVPYEFENREQMIISPATTMVGNKSYHNISAGTWSDDTALTLATMGSFNELDGEYNRDNILKHFRKWLFNGEYTACGMGVFDVGNTTDAAINNGFGNTAEYCNGNGSLMRIIPLAYHLLNEDDIHERWRIVQECSSITHGHIRSILACFFYVEFARLMLLSNHRTEYKASRWFQKAWDHLEVYLRNYPNEIKEFKLQFDFHSNNVMSSTYVMHTLNAAFWCFNNSTSYKECVLKAVNLGDDTDTTAAAAGALAGIYYGYGSIPEEWINTLKNKELLDDLCNNWKVIK